jgi:cytochrome c5
MSEEHQSFIKTPKQLVLLIVAAFVVPIVIIVMLVEFLVVDHTPESKQSAANHVEQRIAPAAYAELKDMTAPRVLLKGEEVYKNSCAACHDSGAAGAPKLGDKAGWGKRLGLGLDGLTQSAIKGKNAMPAKGGNIDLDDEEVKRAVAFMANKAGANFKVQE